MACSLLTERWRAGTEGSEAIAELGEAQSYLECEGGDPAACLALRTAYDDGVATWPESWSGSPQTRLMSACRRWLQAVDLFAFPGAEQLEFRFSVDPDDQIVELNEQNNTTAQTIDITRLEIPWAAFDYAEDGTVLLEGSNTQGALAEWCAARASGHVGAEIDHHPLWPCPYGAAYSTELSQAACFDVSLCERIGEIQCVRGAFSVHTTECRLVEGVGRRELTSCELGARRVCDEQGEVVECE